MHYYFRAPPLSSVSQSRLDYVRALFKGASLWRTSWESICRWCSSPTLDFPRQLAYYSFLIFLLLLLLPFPLHPPVHPPAHPLPAYPAHTYTHAITNALGLQHRQQHRKMEISAACVSVCSRWVQGQEQMSVSDAWMRCIKEKKGGRME